MFQYVKNCQRLVIQKINTNGPSKMLQKQKIDVEQDTFKLLCYRAESVCSDLSNTWLIDWCLTPTLAIFQLYRGKTI
jgi:hypothetical protein